MMQQRSPVNCRHFRKEPDGSWRSVHITDIKDATRTIRIPPGTVFKKGRTLAGTDVVSLLERFCSE